MNKILATLGFLSCTLLSSTSFADDEQLTRGKELFTSAAQPIACAVCHTLKDAEATGTIGPDFDEIKPDAERIRQTMLEGMGAMPSFDAMDEDDIEAVIAYLVSAIE